MHRVFILSPANSGGQRAKLLFNPKARFELAHRLQKGGTAAISEIFSFLSGLYFRGKSAYAAAFANPPSPLHGAYVITSNRGLIPMETPLTLSALAELGTVPIDPGEPRYIKPLRAAVKQIASNAGENCAFVLLGSISTDKYIGPLGDLLGERLLFPPSFVGRGDMSRGGLLLRSVAEGRELDYIAVAGAVRRGKRPEKLSPRSWGYKVAEGITPIPRKV